MSQTALDIEQTKAELHAFAMRLQAEQAKLAILVKRLTVQVEAPVRVVRDRCRRRDG